MAKASTTAKIHLSKDPVLLPLVDTIHLEPLELTNDVYFRLLQSIVFQQLSGKAASTIFSRFTGLFPAAYPDPNQLLTYSIDQLRNVGLSNQKANYVQNVARYFIENDLLRQDWLRLRDEDITQQLTEIKGVGTWTAQMILMFGLGRKDILPVGDLAIQQSMQQLYQLDGKGKQLQQQMIKQAERWRPYRSVASRYLWKWKDTIV
jgi:DNA-3-methyladenine glycosylase II